MGAQDFAKRRPWQFGNRLDGGDAGEGRQVWRGQVEPSPGGGFCCVREEDKLLAGAGIRDAQDAAGVGRHASGGQSVFDGIEVDEFTEDFDRTVRASEKLEGSSREPGAVIGEEESVGRAGRSDVPGATLEPEESGEQRSAADGESSVCLRAGFPAGQEPKAEWVAMRAGRGDLGRCFGHAVGGEDGPAESEGVAGESGRERAAADEHRAEGPRGGEPCGNEVVQLGRDE